MQIGQGQIQRMFDIHSVHPSDGSKHRKLMTLREDEEKIG